MAEAGPQPSATPRGEGEAARAPEPHGGRRTSSAAGALTTVAHREVVLEGGVRIGVTIDAEDEDADDLCAAAVRGAAEAIVSHLAPPPEPPVSTLGLVGASAPMLDLYRMMGRVSASDATVLVLGENGTGKELVARAIHQSSRRAGKRFVATNCSAFNDNLLESELFGHRRGAFTGAIADKPGLFEVADGGTFFLDEVGDMSPALQVKLLRVLQEGTFMPVGATEMRRVDVRIIAATNRDLAGLVRTGAFREDAYYRLNVVTLRVPTLRERPEDIGGLCTHFLGRLADREGKRKRLTDGCLARLRAHRWPGNVRELENEIERLWVLSGDNLVIDDELLSDGIRGHSAAPVRPEDSAGAALTPALMQMKLPDAVETLERQMIEDGLRRARGNKTRAAMALGISRRNLIRKVQALRLGEKSER